MREGSSRDAKTTPTAQKPRGESSWMATFKGYKHFSRDERSRELQRLKDVSTLRRIDHGDAGFELALMLRTAQLRALYETVGPAAARADLVAARSPEGIPASYGCVHGHELAIAQRVAVMTAIAQSRQLPPGTISDLLLHQPASAVTLNERWASFELDKAGFGALFTEWGGCQALDQAFPLNLQLPGDKARAERTRHQVASFLVAASLASDFPVRLDLLSLHAKLDPHEMAKQNDGDLRNALWKRECWLQALYLSVPRERLIHDLGRALDPSPLAAVSDRALDVDLQMREGQIRAIYFGQPTVRAAHSKDLAASAPRRGTSVSDRLANVQRRVLDQYLRAESSEGPVDADAAWLCRPLAAGDCDLEVEFTGADGQPIDPRRMVFNGPDGSVRLVNYITGEVLHPDKFWIPAPAGGLTARSAVSSSGDAARAEHPVQPASSSSASTKAASR